MPPRYGPFYSSFAHEKTRESLASVSMLCCSEALAKYVRRHSPVDAIPCYYADYAYYGPPNASYLRGDAAPPLDARDKRPFDVLCVSPAGPKGLALLLAVAKALPAYRFVCVKTRWTSPAPRFALESSCENVTVADATPDKRALFSLARVLFRAATG